jgi:hypothetical protein
VEINFENDIYGKVPLAAANRLLALSSAAGLGTAAVICAVTAQYIACAPSEYSPIVIDTIYPVTQAHIQKHSQQERFLVSPTPLSLLSRHSARIFTSLATSEHLVTPRLSHSLPEARPQSACRYAMCPCITKAVEQKAVGPLRTAKPYIYLKHTCRHAPYLGHRWLPSSPVGHSTSF